MMCIIFPCGIVQEEKEVKINAIDEELKGIAEVNPTQVEIAERKLNDAVSNIRYTVISG